MNNKYNYAWNRQNDNFMMPSTSNSYSVVEEKPEIFAEDILSKNKGKYMKIYMSFTDSKEWCDRIFEGYLEAWGRDFILLYDKRENKRYMVWNLYIDFIEFQEPLNI